jgi:dienelactone hydrolase
MTDVFGMSFPNTQLIADQFAQNGYLTLIPDVFNGSEVAFPIAPSFDLQTYIATTMPTTETVDAIYERVIRYMRDELGVKRLGGVGYCFGGRYVCRWLKSGGLKEGGLDAGFIAHPSFVLADEVRAVNGPLSIAAAGMYVGKCKHETRMCFSITTYHEKRQKRKKNKKKSGETS